MNKILSLLLAVIICSALLSACNNTITDNTEPANTTQTEGSDSATDYKGDNPTAPDAEVVVKAFLDNSDLWNKIPEYCNWHGYLFLDLNFDGTLELVVTSNAGTGQFSDNAYYSYNSEDGSVSELSFPDKQEDLQSDFFFTDYPKLYKSNETGEKVYVFRDYIRPSGWEYSDIFEKFYAAGNEIKANKLWSVYTAAAQSDDNSDAVLEYSYFLYDENGEIEADKETYDKAISDFESDYTELPLTFEVVQGNDFTEAGKDNQQELFLASYKAFNY